MGYQTEFYGQFDLDREVDEETERVLNGLATTRRMARTGLDESVYGVEGEFFFKDDGNYGQSEDSTIIDFNRPPSTQPGLWCQWALTEDKNGIEWDGGEKFYNYVEWIEYLIEKVLKPRGYVLNGKVEYQGDERDDTGTIVVKDNVVTVTHPGEEREKLILALSDLVEICRFKCSPTDEVILKNGKTNHQALTEAVTVLEGVRGE